MEYRGLKIAKDILLNTFLIGYGFIILFWLILIPFKPFWMHFIVSVWHISNPAFIDMVIVAFFALAKLVLFFYVLVPGLGIFWTLKKLKKKRL
jgi:hypothetical protein